MKRTVLFMAAIMTLSCAWAQKISKNEAKSLQTFLSQTAAKGGNNAEALRMVGNNVATCPGIKVENGHVTEIDFKGKDLAGTLDLSGFTALKKVDVSNNKITSLTLNNNPALVEIYAGKNRIHTMTITGCPQVQMIKVNKNRLADFDLGSVPLLQKFNVSGNMLERLTFQMLSIWNISM